MEWIVLGAVVVAVTTLVWDVVVAIERAGYPALTSDDVVELQQVLFRFLYAPLARGEVDRG